MIAATNRDIGKMVDEGRFRDDLYYRLNVVPILSPPLRQRRGDILQLTQHFVARFSKSLGRTQPNVPDSVVAQPEKYDWPGNIRELQNVIERAMILSNAGWTFRKLVEGWKNKHEKAVYVPVIKHKTDSEFKFSDKVTICYGADFLCVLNALFRGDLYLDPGVKVEHWSSDKKKIKKRNQFRAKASVLPSLYTNSKEVVL